MEDICDFMEELVNIIADALETEGFIVSRDSLPMKVRKGDEEYTLIIISKRDEIGALSQMEFEGKVMVVSLLKDVEKVGDVFIGRESLESMVGRAVISRLTGERASRGGIISSFEDAFAEEKEPVASRKRYPEKEELAKDAFSVSEELLPFYAYYFSVDDEKNPENGIILVNAVDGSVSKAVNSFNPDTGELSSLQRIEPSISEEDSYEKAVKELVKEHTREIEVKKEEGAVTLMEKKVLGIEEEDVELRYLGILYIPFMKVEAPEGTSYIDLSGITG